MKVLELFAGSRSFSKCAERRGHITFTIDKVSFPGIDLVADIMKLKESDIPFKPHIIWASPPCTYFSVSSIGKHWRKNNEPRTKEAESGVLLIKRTLKIIERLNPKYWIIENPRGKLRTLDIIPGIRRTVTYCQYGDKRMKPTDIWSNIIKWVARPVCERGNDCHEEAPRGTQQGTQGLENDYEKSRVPEQLCNEILRHIESEGKG